MFVLSPLARSVETQFTHIVEEALEDLFSLEGTSWRSLDFDQDSLSVKGPLERAEVGGEAFLESGVPAEGSSDLVLFLGFEVQGEFRPIANVELAGASGDLHVAQVWQAPQDDGADRYGLLVDEVLQREAEHWPQGQFTLLLCNIPDTYLHLVVSRLVEGSESEARIYELNLNLPSAAPGAVRRVAERDLQERVRWLLARLNDEDFIEEAGV